MTDATPREETHKEGDDLLDALVARFPGSVVTDSHGQAVVYVDRPQWRPVAQWLRDERDFAICADLTAVDQLVRPSRPLPSGVTPERFEVVANFLSLSANRRLRVICQVPDEGEVESLVPVYPGVDFPEREVFDLLGVRFAGHPDLTRLLMPDDWEGHPLRKDDAPARVPVQFKEAPRPL